MKDSASENVPLAVRLRPHDLEEFVGQSHVLGEGKLLRRAITSKRVPSLILWGPPGCGKTTLGFIVAKELGADFEYINAAFSSVAEIKKIIARGRDRFSKEGKKEVLFIDEIHRFNKLQQEALIPDTELASIHLVGATIYNPSYYLIPSLISRSLVAKFKPLTKEDILFILDRTVKDKNNWGSVLVEADEDALDYIATLSSGDARKALNALEIGVISTTARDDNKIVIDLGVARESIQKNVFYDKKDSYHYDTISAFIKSIRGSDVDSALYWLAKMLAAGEDPRFIARRLVILASEDVGNANPFALVLATSCFKAVEFVGMPEAQLNLAHTTIYLAASPKSNASYMALKRAQEDIEEEETNEVPQHIKTHSKDYKYPHSYGGYVEQDYGAKKRYYFPKDIGEERRIKQFLEYLCKSKNR
ncbi:MAG: replication-associated recombination protein A [Candidatus Omnitrophota bacterium]|nr:MAG: replication-associated recombination protein A [Candidatus Omnitrophota bacterium]